MARLTAHPPDTRKAIEALLHEGRLRPTAIAARTGVPRSTIATWLAQLAPPGTPPQRKTVRRPRKPSRLTTRQRTALARLLPLPGLDPKDLAQAIGLSRDTAIRTFAAAGLRRPHATRAASQPPTPVALDAALRAHAARQIAAFDARLTGGDSEIDSARVLRDLSGLRRPMSSMRRRKPLRSRMSARRRISSRAGPASCGTSPPSLRPTWPSGFLAGLTPHDLTSLERDWLALARPDQLPPHGDWTTWAVIGGRGSGKTRTGAEWVRALALGDPAFTAEPVAQIALVGETFADVRDVMIEGPSGLLALPRLSGAAPVWQPSRRRVAFDNGAVALAFSSEEPDSLRGPQFGAAWADELAKWRHAETAFDMMQFGLRLGRRPRGLVTTTPRPMPLLRRLLADPRVAVSRARTADNADNLAPSFLDEVVGRYRGTRLGRQELDGELIEDRPDALWQRETIEAGRVAVAPDLVRIVVAIDPPASSRADSDACGIVAAGIGTDGAAYVLADATLNRASPQAWASVALGLYHRLNADALVAEVNQGGEMVLAVLAQIDPAVPVTPVRAMRGKFLRAEPVSMLYAQGRVHHVGALPALEDELCDFGPRQGTFGLTAGTSPDRLDALVWALTHLMLQPTSEPRVRVL